MIGACHAVILFLMEAYHYAWLSVHPNRSEDWLKARLFEGFDVHHLDSNHANNAPDNLVLIEHRDHMRLHGTGGNRLAMARRGPAKGYRHKPKAIEAKADDRPKPSSAKKSSFPNWYAS